MLNATTLGRELARIRRKAGLRQAELAGRLDTTQTAISRTEAGRSMPSVPTLDRWAAACGRPLVLRFGQAAQMPSPDERRRRVRKVLGDYRFNPWQRDPSEAEAESLIADGLTRDRFAG